MSISVQLQWTTHGAQTMELINNYNRECQYASPLTLTIVCKNQ